MDKIIIEAIIELFAIIAGKSLNNSVQSKIVSNILSKYLTSDQLAYYLDQFEVLKTKYTSEHNPSKQSKVAVKILKLCNQINTGSNLIGKYTITVKLHEFIKENSENQQETLGLVASIFESFYLPKSDFEVISYLSNLSNSADSEGVISLPINQTNNKKQIQVGSLPNSIRFYYLKNAHAFIANNFTNDTFFINGQLFESNSLSIITTGSIIKGNKIESIYFSDIVKYFIDDFDKTYIEFSVKIDEHLFDRNFHALHKIHFQEKSGRMAGIMGGSGAGKTTLLNILNGNEKPSKGEIFINGISVYQNLNALKKYIGYVSQDDLLLEELSVFENLYYSALLCFGNLPKLEVKDKTLKTLKELDLLKIKDLKVGSVLNKTISGGQRKRLNIALELIREPAILFVDEPTSGLSSRDSINVMDLLKELTLKNKLVFVVIHQPSSVIFKLFDSLLLLDNGGYPIYFGNPVESLGYFKELNQFANTFENECKTCGNVNVEDIFDIVENKVHNEYGLETDERKIKPKEWNIFFKRSVEKFNVHQHDLPKLEIKIPHFWKQFKVFITRDAKTKIFNKSYMIITFLEGPLISLITAFFLKETQSSTYFLYENDNIPAYLLICIVAAIFLGLSVSAGEIIKDKKILKRETYLNLSRNSYLMAKITNLSVISAFQAFGFVVVGNYILGLNGMIGGYWAICTITFIAANLLGLNISTAFKNNASIYILIPILIIPQLLLSGLLVNFDKLNSILREKGKVPIIADVMLSRWAFEALVVYQCTENEFDKTVYPFNQKLSEADFYTIYWLEKYDADETTKRIELKKLKEQFPQIGNVDNKETIEAYFLNIGKKYKQAKDALIEQLNTTENSNFSQLQMIHSNKNLLNLVRRNNETNKITINSKGEIIQLSDAIYQTNATALIGGTLFSPYKNLFGVKMKTQYANGIVILISFVLLYISLYFEWFKKLSTLHLFILKMKNVNPKRESY